MTISVASTRLAMAAAYTGLCTHAAAHSGPPSSGNELTGAGSSRGAIAWGTPTDDGTATTVVGVATISLPTAGGTVDYIGHWSQLAVGGTLRDGQSDVTNVTYPAGGGNAVVTITYVQR